MIRTNLSCVLFDGFRVCVIRAVTVREGEDQLCTERRSGAVPRLIETGHHRRPAPLQYV